MRLPKVLSADGHRTRLHTARGELVPMRAWGDIPAAIVDRLRKRDMTAPWMAPGAIRFLEAHMRPDFAVLELGSGASTAWFAERAARVVSYESNEQWFASTQQAVADRGVAERVELRSLPLREIPAAVRALTDTFDLVIVDTDLDHEASRPHLVDAAAPLVPVGGFLVLDDSDRPIFDTDLPEEQWERHRFPGIKSFPLDATETTVWRRRASDA
jgi:predicted O-methyltransferase YrrM